MRAGEPRGGSLSAGGEPLSDAAGLRRYLMTEGVMGYLPDWYPLILAARYLGVPPWALYEQPVYWLDWAIIARSAEAEAENGPKVTNS